MLKPPNNKYTTCTSQSRRRRTKKFVYISVVTQGRSIQALDALPNIVIAWKKKKIRAVILTVLDNENSLFLLTPSSDTRKKSARKKWPREILEARSTLAPTISLGHFFSRGSLSRLARQTK